MPWLELQRVEAKGCDNGSDEDTCPWIGEPVFGPTEPFRTPVEEAAAVEGYFFPQAETLPTAAARSQASSPGRRSRLDDTVESMLQGGSSSSRWQNEPGDGNDNQNRQSKNFTADGEHNQEMHRVLHAQGQCEPCGYYARKGDGCRKGLLCPFCHFCDNFSYQTWKRRSRRSRKREERGQQSTEGGTEEAEHVVDECSEDIPGPCLT
eukprot:TRINITY_DN111270_c0_g1_i1.p1 TRINITY_DN111270_c0_g1~~TRINITY_DN111270_c0_g1_i1.p1  ORF type:complete len:207 (+),score=21.76 TRINITY_DN111270_c0_g1_i1:92-712(+)